MERKAARKSGRMGFPTFHSFFFIYMSLGLRLDELFVIMFYKIKPYKTL